MCEYIRNWKTSVSFELQVQSAEARNHTFMSFIFDSTLYSAEAHIDMSAQLIVGPSLTYLLVLVVTSVFLAS